MRKRIDFVDELRDPVRRSDYSADGGFYLPGAEAWELYELDRAYAKSQESLYPDITITCDTPPLAPKSDRLTSYVLYGALLGILEVFAFFFFGGHL